MDAKPRVTVKSAKRYKVQIDGCEVSCHDEIVSVTSKKQGTSASAASPIDFVSATGTVRVQQDFISCDNFSLIDSRMLYGVVRVAKGN